MEWDKYSNMEVIMLGPLLTPVISLVAGILVLIFPTILNYIVAIYLIIIGLVGILGRIGS